MVRIIVFVGGLFGLAALAFLTHFWQGPAIEDDLKTRVAVELANQGLDWAYVAQIDGRDITLGGDAPGLDDRDRAVALADAQWGVRSVSSLIAVTPPALPTIETQPLPAPAVPDGQAPAPPPEVPPPAPPPEVTPAAAENSYEARAQFRAGVLQLAGDVPSAEEKSAVLRFAREAFPGARIIDELRVAPGIPDGAWPDVLRTGLAQLAQFTTGDMRLKGRKLLLSGSVAVPDTREAAIRALRDLPAAYTGIADIAVSGAAPAAVVETGVGPEASAAIACQQAATAMTQPEPKILFASGKATLSREALAQLAELAAVFKTCPDARIEVQGHTDSTGREETNAKLSRERAEAVRAALIGLGISRARLTAKGLGATRMLVAETGDSPAAIEALRARNRRIEFVVR